MDFAHRFMETVLRETGATRAFTYPGSPPRYFYEAVIDSDDAALEQGVREQHLLHMAQAHYYRRLETGDEEVPVVILSGEMGEAMASQPLIAGSMSAPCLVIVAEAAFPHTGSEYAIAHQTDRGTTPEKLGDDADVVMEHDNVVDRVLLDEADDAEDAVEELVAEIREQSGVGILHIPAYAYTEGFEEAIVHDPAHLTMDELGEHWRGSDRPAILAGGGAKHPQTRDRIEQLARDTGAVITATMAMEGYFDTNYAGRIGVIGDPEANRALAEADFVLVLGSSLNNLHTSFNPEHIQMFQSKAYQVEINSSRESIFAHAFINADVDDVLDALPVWSGDSWFDPNTVDADDPAESVPTAVQAFADVLREDYPEKVVNLGVGNTTLWLPYALGPDIRKEVSRSGSMGEVVSGLAREDDPVLVLGDGEFEMDVSLLTEAQYHDRSATIFVVNNQRLGLVTERQEAEFDDILTPKQNPIDYEHLADGFRGVESYTASSADEARRAASEALNSDAVSIVEVRVDGRLDRQAYDLFDLPGIAVEN